MICCCFVLFFKEDSCFYNFYLSFRHVTYLQFEFSHRARGAAVVCLFSFLKVNCPPLVDCLVLYPSPIITPQTSKIPQPLLNCYLPSQHFWRAETDDSESRFITISINMVTRGQEGVHPTGTHTCALWTCDH